MKATTSLTKKCLITNDENILSDPDEALQLGKSMSLTEAEEQEEARRVHETHKCLVTKKTSNDKEEGRFASDMHKATKANRRAYKSYQQSTGSSEGVGITPEVPDEPKGSLAIISKVSCLKPIGRVGSNTFTLKGFNSYRKVNSGKHYPFVSHEGKTLASAHNFPIRCYED
uniref:Zinc finger MYM-type protein 1-like n=1 Tax=Tanacetum cinerariifolium TaxID=118510 RepID=A0A699HPE6_TANCI|nr:zinc finger MYM-type protein 1-like [Tanacetum cinerariifolium]